MASRTVAEVEAVLCAELQQMLDEDVATISDAAGCLADALRTAAWRKTASSDTGRAPGARVKTLFILRHHEA